MEGEYQRAINRMARSTLGAFRSTPQGILAAESGLTPARALLNYRQARFAQRPEEILERDNGAIMARLRAATGIRRGETVEPQTWSERWVFPGQVKVPDDGPALENARNARTGGTIWTDGSRLDSGRVGAACVW